MSDKKLVPMNLVNEAMFQISVFCKHHKQELPMDKVVKIAIALREQTEFEWTPSMVPGFRRIHFVKAHERDGKHIVAVVSDYNNGACNTPLTEELNAAIRTACKDQWAD